MTFQIRIKTSSKLEQAIQYLLDNPRTDQAAMRKSGYGWTEITTAYSLMRQSDNFTAGKYLDVSPTTVIQNQTVTGSTQLGVVESHASDATDIRFSEMPSLIQPQAFWRKPSWYSSMKAMVDAKQHIALSGPPGIGKSTAVEILACETHTPLVNIGGDAGLRRRDLTGNTELLNGHTRFTVAEYATAAVLGWWVKIDEVNAAEPDALMYINSQLSAPYMVNFYGRSYPVHPNFRLFVTYNPGLVGTKPLPDAFKDRFFPVKLEFPNEAGLRQMLEANGMQHIENMSDEWMDVIVKYGLKAWQQHLDGRMRYQITPRRLMHAVMLVKQGLDVYKALKAAVVAAVDNPAEAKLLDQLVQSVKPM